jgi:hypothetical protein
LSGQIRALLARTAPEREAAGVLAQLGWGDWADYLCSAAEPADGDLRAPQLHTFVTESKAKSRTAALFMSRRPSYW